MSIFKSKKKETARKQQQVVLDMIEEYEELCKKICKATGTEITDMLSELDETSGAVLGACIQSSKKILDLAVEQAMIMDRVEDRIVDLEYQNTKLLNKMELLLEK